MISGISVKEDAVTKLGERCMINLTTILNDLLGAALVIAVLIAAAVVIKLIAFAVDKIRGGKSAGTENIKESATDVPLRNELKLINVDEKTAALIMAIVSHESGIPLFELVFTSIKLV